MPAASLAGAPYNLKQQRKKHMQAITILDTSIRQDAEGRYSLNDLHRAAMAAAGRDGNPNDDHQRPGRFFAGAVAKALAKKHAESGLISVTGRCGGTFATKEIAIKYAEWLGGQASVEFLASVGVGALIVNAKRAEFVFGEEIVERLFSGYTIIRQFPVFGGKYRIDWYIPELRLAVEFDEAHHTNPANAVADAARQSEIESAIGCRFLRYKAD